MMIHRLQIHQARLNRALVGISTSLLALSLLLPSNRPPDTRDKLSTNLGGFGLSAQEDQTSEPSATMTSNTPTSTPSDTPTQTSTSSPTATLTATATLTPTLHPSPTSTSSPTATFTATVTPTASPEPTHAPSYPPFTILINELAWAGTLAFAYDEWIELYNPGANPIDLEDWRLEDGGDIDIKLEGTIGPHSFFLLERTDNSTISNLSADLIYKGGMSNGGETLWLKDPSGSIIDSANAAGGAWPAGIARSRASMERRGGSDIPGNWVTWNGTVSSGLDAGGNAIPGTPRQANSILYPTPTPTSIPGRVVINEVLIRPHYDWNHSGEADLGDEFIELYNHGPGAVNLCGWVLDDLVGGGARPYTLPSWTLRPRERVALFRAQTRISLNDSGDTVHLFDPSGHLIDQIRFIRVKAYNLSYGRLPDGSSHFAYGLWPTPRCANVLFVEPSSLITPSPAEDTIPWQGWGKCPLETIPQPLLPRYTQHPAMMRWMLSLGIYICR